MAFDRYGQLAPHAPRVWLRTATTEFAASCPFSPFASDEDELSDELFPDTQDRAPSTGRYDAAFVGHAVEGEFRANGSSGGMVTWTLDELFRLGRIDAVAHVAPCDRQATGRFFGYRIARSADEIRTGAKSRYYPVELSGVLDEIRATPGRYAVVGIPCFVKAVQLMRRRDPLLRERIVVTLGLFCGHMKSARFVESFAWQMDVDIGDVDAVEFRRKDVDRPASTYTAELRLHDGRAARRDWWNLSDGDWGAGFFQHSACNSCDDVMAETADISFGDAWVEPYSSDGRGTNVVVTRTAATTSLLESATAEGRLELAPVDDAFVAETQAAGLRQRREGLGYRLTWRRRGFTPRKRVAPNRAIALRRKLVYRSRSSISGWSHRVFWLARTVRRPQLYVKWAAGAQAGYHAFAYSRGRLGAFVDRFVPDP